MRTQININYQTLFRSIVLSAAFCALIFGSLYLLFSMLSWLFESLPVFASIFGICVGLGALIVYDADGFQWDNNPRIAIRQIGKGDHHGG